MTLPSHHAQAHALRAWHRLQLNSRKQRKRLSAAPLTFQQGTTPPIDAGATDSSGKAGSAPPVSFEALSSADMAASCCAVARMRAAARSAAARCGVPAFLGRPGRRGAGATGAGSSSAAGAAGASTSARRKLFIPIGQASRAVVMLHTFVCFKVEDISDISVAKRYGHAFCDWGVLWGGHLFRCGSFLSCGGSFLLWCSSCRGVLGGRGAGASAWRRRCRVPGGRTLRRTPAGRRGRRLLGGRGCRRLLSCRLPRSAAAARLHRTSADCQISDSGCDMDAPVLSSS